MDKSRNSQLVCMDWLSVLTKRTMAPKSNKLILGDQSAGPTQKNQLPGEPDDTSRSSSDLSKFFVWSPHCNVEVMLQRIAQIDRKYRNSLIIKGHYFGIRSTKQEKNNLTRFEMVARKFATKTMVKIFREVGKKWGWYVREHKQYEDRKATKEKRDKPEIVETEVEDSTRWLKVGTINVNGATHSRVAG